MCRDDIPVTCHSTSAQHDIYHYCPRHAWREGRRRELSVIAAARPCANRLQHKALLSQIVATVEAGASNDSGDPPGLSRRRREAFPRPEDDLLGKFAVEFTNPL